MAKMEKIRNMQIVDNKKDKFFCFPMISVACTGSGYDKEKFKQLLFFLLSSPFLKAPQYAYIDEAKFIS